LRVQNWKARFATELHLCEDRGMTKRIAGRTSGVQAFGTPSAGEGVVMRGVRGVVERRSLDGAAIWVRFPGGGEDRMFTYRRSIDAWREFPEQVRDPSLTLPWRD
jgi:hypothetical protein